MKVCMLTTYPPQMCGVGDYTSELCNAMAKNTEHKIDVLTFKINKTEKKNKKNIDVHRKLNIDSTPELIGKEIKKIKPDIAHFQSTTFGYPNKFNYFSDYLAGIPLITTVHDTPWSYRTFYKLKSLRNLYNNSKRLIVHTNEIRDKINNFHKIGTDKLFKLPHGIYTKKYNPNVDSRKFKKWYGINDDFNLLFFGFLRPYKGLKFLIKSYKKIMKKNNKIKLIIAGDVPKNDGRYLFKFKKTSNYKNEIINYAKKLGVYHNTFFTGYIKDSMMPMCFASADVVTFPYKVTQSGPMHRALGSGKPLVALDCLGAREVIRNEVNGFLIDTEEKSINFVPDDLSRT